eukprot:jgi/Botrbrau1/20120/Bobra.0173s0023.1
MPYSYGAVGDENHLISACPVLGHVLQRFTGVSLYEPLLAVVPLAGATSARLPGLPKTVFPWFSSLPIYRSAWDLHCAPWGFIHPTKLYLYNRGWTNVIFPRVA